MTELCDLEAVELRRRIGTKEISPVEVLASCEARIEAVNPALNAVVALDLERPYVANTVEFLNRRIRAGRRRPGAAARPAGRDQGPDRHRGAAHDLRLAHL